MTDTAYFGHAFAKLTGHDPFRWQRRLFEEWFAVGKVPSACDLPTGLGKTSVMALWLIARAMGVSLPRRLVYVVDRRAVVDQATEFAERLRENAPVALGIHDLPISTLRGQFVDNRQWLADPSGSAIIVGTIDMIGSRLLFEGYSVSRRMRPYHAGMLGADALLVLDEAHLCPPFEALLSAIAEDPERQFAALSLDDREIVPPFRLLSLSATGRDDEANEARTVFRLSPQDREDPVVAERLSADKHLVVDAVDDAKALAPALAERAWSLAKAEGPARVLVYCNSREEP